MQRCRIMLAWMLLVVWGSAPCESRAAETTAGDMEDPAYWKPAQQALAKLGDGFLVWETHRTGRWSIWTIKLDGTGLKQLSPEEADKDQMAPKISPNGRQVAYLSFPKTAIKMAGGGEPVNGQVVPLHLINADGTNDKIVAPDARVYGGWDRAITWFNDNELAYISGDGNTYQLNVATGQSTVLIKGGLWLPNSKKTYAAWAFGTFSPMDAKQQLVKPFPHMGGCQPYFTQDGEWGFWESYVGGPFGVAHLSSWETTADRSLVTEIMGKERFLLGGHSYIYFSMFSADKRLLTFAGRRPDAPGEYSSPDWKIFVVQTDPQDLSVIGKPVRYTFDPGCDRFPDVWQKPLPLGFQSTKAPYTAEFKLPSGGGAEWDYGDGSKGSAASHLYSTTGVYTVTATRGKDVLCGQVNIRDAQPPKALRAVLKDQREVVVVFDGPVNAKNATASLKSQAKIEKSMPGEDGWTLRILLAQPLKRADALVLDNVVDVAQKPNRMAPVELPIEVRVWPATQEGIVFLWQGANKPNLLHDPEKGERSCRIVAKGRAWTDRNNDLVLDGGLFAVEDLSPVFSKAIQKSNAFTIELCLYPTRRWEDTTHAILSYGLFYRKHSFVLRQKDQDFTLGAPGDGGYLAVTYNDGQLVAYEGVNNSVNTVSGNQYMAHAVASTNNFSLDLAAFAAEPLLIGNNSQAQNMPSYQSAPGLVISGIALYDRALRPEELSANYAAHLAVNSARTPVEQFRFPARLVAVSKVPQPKEIAPYTRALAVNEYVTPDPANPSGERTFRAAYWALLDGEFQPLAQANVNRAYQDTIPGLQLFSDNPQLAREYTSDTLPIAPDVPLYFWPEPTRNAWTAARNWAVTGPFAAASDTPPADPNLAWKPVELPAGGDLYMDMNPLFPNAKETVACGRLCVKSPTNRTAIVTVESGGGIKAWLNGKQVMSFKNDRFPLRKQKRELVELKAGWNELVIEATKAGPLWGFVADILSTEGREMMDCGRAPSLPKPPEPGAK